MNAKSKKPSSTRPSQESSGNSRSSKPAAASKQKPKPQQNKDQKSKPQESPAQTRKPKKKNAAPEAPEKQLVRLHDLIGLTVLNLPQGLREILGEEAYKNCLKDVQEMVLTVILREPGDVVYMHMPILVREMPQDGPAQMYLDQLLAACASPAAAPTARKKRRRA